MSYKYNLLDDGWILTDANMIEVKKCGIYDFDFKMYMPTRYPFISVDPGFGKIEEIGYEVGKGTYYLHIAGKNIGKIII